MVVVDIAAELGPHMGFVVVRKGCAEAAWAAPAGCCTDYPGPRKLQNETHTHTHTQ